MSGLSYKEYTEWRNRVQKALYSINDGTHVEVIDPAEYYNYEIKFHQTEKEIMRFELRAVESSSLLIANLDRINESVGSVFELAYAFKNNIPIIGLKEKDDIAIHPWIEEVCDRIETSVDNLAQYIKDYYMN